MGNRKLRSTAKRNAILFVSAVFCLGASIAYVAVTRKPTLIMPPETPDELAMRSSPDNAYFTLAEAVKLLPKKPGALGVPDAEYPDFQVAYRPAPGSIGEMLDIKRPDDDADLVAYLNQCEPALAKARKAFDKPYYREPLDWSDFEIAGREYEKRFQRKVSFTDLARAFTACGAYDQRVNGDDIRALTHLVEAMRLGSILMSDCDGSDGFVTQLMALWHFLEWSHRASRSALEQAPHQLRDVEKAGPSAEKLLEFGWRVLDNTRRVDPRMFGRSQGLLTSYQMGLQITAARRWIASHRDELRAAAAMDYTDFRNWRGSYPELRPVTRNSPLSRLDPMETAQAIALWRALLKANFAAATLAIAIEQYQRDHRDYPESLAALVPKYLETVPNDPFQSGPFIYRREGSDYWLYSVGDNGRDDGGVSRFDGDRVFHQPPAPEERSPVARRNR